MGTWARKNTEITPDQAEPAHPSLCSAGSTSLRDEKMRSGWSVIGVLRVVRVGRAPTQSASRLQSISIP